MVKSKFYNLDTDETLASNSDYYIPSQKATKAYIDNISSTQTNTISDCILEIPQNIKLTLENNVLTLKAGSILTRTGSTYATSTTTVDRTYTISSSFTSGFYLIFADMASIHAPRILSKVSSGNSSSFPTDNLDQFNVYFNIDDQLIYKYDNTTSTWVNYFSCYPICLIEMKSGIASFAKDDNGYDIIFNTMCFIGKYAIAYPEIKGLIADGLNEDGTLKSKLYINSALQIIDSANASGYIISQNPLNVNLSRTGSIIEVETLDDIDLSTTNWTRYYVKSLNKYYVHFSADLTPYEHLTIASFKADSNGIYNITVRQPVRLATTEITDKINADLSDVVHKSGTENITGQKTFTSDLVLERPSVQPILRSTRYEKATAPASDTYMCHRRYLDKNNKSVFSEYYYIPRNTNKPSYILRFYNVSTSDATGYKDVIVANYDGTNSIYAIGATTATGPHPAATNSTTSNNLTTVAWVNDPAKSTNVVHRTGDETITGAKTFDSSSVTININADGNGNGLTIQNKADNTKYSYLKQYLTSDNTYWTRLANNAYNKNTFIDLTTTENGFRTISLSYADTAVTVTPTDDNTTSKQIDTVGARNTKLQGYATTSLDNLNSTGQMIVDSQNGTISNCILEIPQNIKMEIDSENYVILKAGSIFVLANGPTYQTVTTTSDIRIKGITDGSGDGCYLCIPQQSNMQIWKIDSLLSVATLNDLPTPQSKKELFYVASELKYYYHGSGATTWLSVDIDGYPVCLLKRENNIWSFAKDSNNRDMIFNGAGFIGHHIFMYPNIKGLWAKGINIDGTLKSGYSLNNSFKIYEMSTGFQVSGINRFIGLMDSQNSADSNGNWRGYLEVDTYEDLHSTGYDWIRQYVKSENQCYLWANGNKFFNINELEQTRGTPFIEYYYDGTTVTSFAIRQPIRTATVEMLNNVVENQGDLLPNFDTMPVLQTIEFDTADSNWHTIFTRTNTETNPANLTDVLYFRMTVTGTSINQVIDYGVIFRGQLNYPIVISKQYPGTSNGNYTGSRYYRTLFPKDLNNGYDWSFEVLQNRNNNARHYKVEIFKTTSKITWTAGIATIFNSTYHNSNQQGTETNAGYHINWLNGTINQSSWASNINGQLSKIINTSYPAGEALLANQFLFMNNNKYYPATNKALAVEPGFGIQVNITAYNINNDVGWDRIRQKCRITSLTNIPHDTLARGNPCYFRCTKDSEGNIYSDNYIATSMSAGYVWYYVGTAESASIINIDTTQSFFITLDNNRETTHINGKRINDKVFGGSISNCILDIPQNIKLELDANVLTLKAGSILTKTGSTYATITTTVDQTHTIPDTLEDGKYYIMSSNGGFWSPTAETEYSVTAATGRHVRSGSILPSSGDASHDMFYLTTDKSIYFWSGTGEWQNRTESNNACYPLCIIEMKSGVASFAKDSNGNDMIFNSSGFIGHHAFIYPNPRLVLKPNGFNEDGSLASIVIKNSALRVIEMLSKTNCWIAAELNGSLVNLSAYKTVKHYSDADFTRANARYYIEDKNRILFQHNNVISEATQTPLLKYTSNGTIVTDFTIRQPIRLVTTEMLDEITNNIIPTSDKRNIGEIVQSTIPLNDAALHLLDGSLISGSGTYSAFVTYMSGLVSSHSNLFCSEADWQATYTEYGVCGKFVYNSTDNTIRLPYITGFIEGTLTESSLGNVTEAGLPNITGILGTSGYVGEQWSKDSLLTGAFYKDTSLTEKRISDDVTAIANKEYNFGFDASLSNDIYDNSNTVQPQSIKVFYYISLANTIKTDIEVDIGNIQTELNNTVKTTDLHEASVVIETYKNGADWYRIWSDGWIEQSGRVSISQDTQTTVSLLKSFSDINYTVLITANKSGLQSSGDGNFTVEYLSTTQFKWGNGDDFSGVGIWYACGY